MRFHYSINRRGRGVTLVEVMVVVAILTLLAGLMFGVIGPARRKASQMQCLSNIRQVGQAFLMYLEDNSGTSPVVKLDPAERWQREVAAYGAGATVACPQFTNASDRYRIGNLGYAPNACLYRLSEVREPSRTVLLTDVAEFFGESKQGVVWIEVVALAVPDIYQLPQEHLEAQYPGQSVSAVGAYGAVRHNGGALYVFADGHAKWHRPEEVIRWEAWADCYPPPDARKILGREGGPVFSGKIKFPE